MIAGDLGVIQLARQIRIKYLFSRGFKTHDIVRLFASTEQTQRDCGETVGLLEDDRLHGDSRQLETLLYFCCSCKCGSIMFCIDSRAVVPAARSGEGTINQG